MATKNPQEVNNMKSNKKTPAQPAEITQETHFSGKRSSLRMSRRLFLRNASIATASLGVTAGAFGRMSTAPAPVPIRHTMLYIFLRGGADGLSLCVPMMDTLHYQTVRPTIHVMNPINLQTNRWGLSPAMTPLLTAWGAGELAFVPASGIAYNSVADKDRSHFSAMDRVEFGIDPAFPVGSLSDGWAARHLESAQFSTEAPLRGMIMQKLGTKTFAAAPKSLAIPDASDYTFPGNDPLMPPATQAMYAFTSHGPSKSAGANTFAAFDYLGGITFRTGPLIPDGYPDTEFGAQLRRLADIILSKNPPEIAEIDLGGWDHHNNQGVNSGTMYDLMEELSTGLAQFQQDLSAQNPFTNSPWKNSVSTIAMTEFGRRVAENSSKGTDHGWGGCMMVMGGNQVNGGVIYDNGFTTLAGETDTDGDVNVLTDHRAVIVSCLLKKMMQTNAPTVYPQYAYNPATDDPGIFV